MLTVGTGGKDIWKDLENRLILDPISLKVIFQRQFCSIGKLMIFNLLWKVGTVLHLSFAGFI